MIWVQFDWTTVERGSSVAKGVWIADDSVKGPVAGTITYAPCHHLYHNHSAPRVLLDVQGSIPLDVAVVNIVKIWTSLKRWAIEAFIAYGAVEHSNTNGTASHQAEQQHAQVYSSDIGLGLYISCYLGKLGHQSVMCELAFDGDLDLTPEYCLDPMPYRHLLLSPAT